MNIIEKIAQTKEGISYSQGKIESYKELVESYEARIEKLRSLISDEEEKMRSKCSHDIALGFDFGSEKAGYCLICNRGITLKNAKNVINPDHVLDGDDIAENFNNYVTKAISLMYKFISENPNVTFEELKKLMEEEIRNKGNKR